MFKFRAPSARKFGLVVQHVSDETLIYDMDTQKAFCLNRSAAIVWQFCDGKKSVEEIVSSIKAAGEDEFGLALVEFALAQLEAENLLESKADFQNVEPGISRRQTIRRLGLTSVAALPIVAAVVAPAAGQAASCRANDASCTASAQCCSGCCKSVGGGINQCKPGGGACLP